MLGSTVVGTYGYMAPEQFRGAASAASDLYGLGGTLLFLLSGRPPSAFPIDRMRIDISAGGGLAPRASCPLAGASPSLQKTPARRRSPWNFFRQSRFDGVRWHLRSLTCFCACSQAESSLRIVSLPCSQNGRTLGGGA